MGTKIITAMAIASSIMVVQRAAYGGRERVASGKNIIYYRAYTRSRAHKLCAFDSVNVDKRATRIITQNTITLWSVDNTKKIQILDVHVHLSKQLVVASWMTLGYVNIQ